MGPENRAIYAPRPCSGSYEVLPQDEGCGLSEKGALAHYILALPVIEHYEDKALSLHLCLYGSRGEQGIQTEKECKDMTSTPAPWYEKQYAQLDFESTQVRHIGACSMSPPPDALVQRVERDGKRQIVSVEWNVQNLCVNGVRYPETRIRLKNMEKSQGQKPSLDKPAA